MRPEEQPSGARAVPAPGKNVGQGDRNRFYPPKGKGGTESPRKTRPDWLNLPGETKRGVPWGRLFPAAYVRRLFRSRQPPGSGGPFRQRLGELLHRLGMLYVFDRRQLARHAIER